MRSVILLSCILTLTGNVSATEQSRSVLPEVLDLAYVLREVDVSTHYSLLRRDAESKRSEAVVAESEGAYATEADINLRARWIDRNDLSIDPSSQDHKASLNITKRLYDFGVTGNLDDSNRSLLSAAGIDDRVAMSMHRIEIARTYFDVLLSDLAYAWANEAMAMEYVTLDKQRDRYELKQIDEIVLLEHEALYETALAERMRASLRQRVSRSRLADVLAVPGELPAKLAMPTLPELREPLADPSELISQAFSRSPQLKAREQALAASRDRYEAESSRWQPSLEAGIELAEYSRDLPSRNDWRAELNLRIPLFESGMNRAKAALAWSQLKASQAELEKTRTQAREDIYMAWENISSLISRSRALELSMKHAERALDKSRGEYELELRSDLGDSLVRMSRLRYEKAAMDFQLAVERMKLALMLGDDPVALVLGETDR